MWKRRLFKGDCRGLSRAGSRSQKLRALPPALCRAQEEADGPTPPEPLPHAQWGPCTPRVPLPSGIPPHADKEAGSGLVCAERGSKPCVAAPEASS